MSRTVATGKVGQFQIDPNLLGFGIKGTLFGVQSTNRIDGGIFGDLSSIGLNTHSGFIGAINTTGGSHATQTYNISDIGDLASIQNEVKDGSGSTYQTNLASTGFKLGTGSSSYTLPTTRGTNGQVATSNGSGGSSWTTVSTSTPGLAAVLGVSPANTGIAITGTNFLSASSSNISILRNSNGFSVVGLDSKDQVYLRGVNNGDSALTNNYIGFDVSGNPQSKGFYSTLGSGFVYTPISGPGLDDFSVVGTYTGPFAASISYTIDSNSTYFVDIVYVGPSTFSDHLPVTWSSGTESATIENYVPAQTHIELTNTTAAPQVGDILDDGAGNTATVTSIGHGPFDTYAFTNGASFNFFQEIEAGVPGPANAGIEAVFVAQTGHTIGDAWITTNANSALVQGMLIDYATGTWKFGDTNNDLDGNSLEISSVTHSINIGNASAGTGTYNDVVQIGHGTTATQNGAVAIGTNTASTGTNTTAVGYQANGNGDNGVAIGASAALNGTASSIVIGVGAAAYSDYVFTTGGSSEWYVGPQQTVSTYLQGGNIYGAGISPGQTDRDGANLGIWGGAGVGSGDGGNLSLGVALPTASGTSQNAYSTLIKMLGTNGEVIVGSPTPVVFGSNATSYIDILSGSGSMSFNTSDGTNSMALTNAPDSSTLMGSQFGTGYAFNDTARTIYLGDSTGSVLTADFSSRMIKIGDVNKSQNELSFNTDPGTLLHFTDIGSYFLIDDSSNVPLFSVRNGVNAFTATSTTVVEDNIGSTTYGGTLNYASGFTGKSRAFFTGSHSVSPSGVLLPTGVNAPIGTKFTVDDLGFLGLTDPITVDAGTGNLITGVGTQAQTFVIGVNGGSATFVKLTSTDWMVE